MLLRGLGAADAQQRARWTGKTLPLTSTSAQPVEDLESPWSSAQFQFIYELGAYEPRPSCRAHTPGSRSGPAPTRAASPTSLPDPAASWVRASSRARCIELSGGAEQWQTFDQALWDQLVAGAVGIFQ